MKHVPVQRHPDLFEGGPMRRHTTRSGARSGSTDPDHFDEDCDRDLSIDGKRGG